MYQYNFNLGGKIKKKMQEMIQTFHDAEKEKFYQLCWSENCRKVSVNSGVKKCREYLFNK